MLHRQLTSRRRTLRATMVVNPNVLILVLTRGTVAMVVAIKPVASSMVVLVAEDTMRTMEVLVAVAGGGEAVEVSVVAMAATAMATTTLLASTVAGAIKEALTHMRLHQWALAMLVLATLFGTGLLKGPNG